MQPRRSTSRLPSREPSISRASNTLSSTIPASSTDSTTPRGPSSSSPTSVDRTRRSFKTSASSTIATFRSDGAGVVGPRQHGQHGIVVHLGGDSPRLPAPRDECSPPAHGPRGEPSRRHAGSPVRGSTKSLSVGGLRLRHDRSYYFAVTKGQDTRDLILRAAFDEIRATGLEALSIGGLARTVGLSKSGLFAHFRSKEALQLAVLDYAAAEFTQQVMLPAFKAPRGEPRVRALFEQWVAWLDASDHAIGCVFVAGASEFDSREGPVRRQIVDTIGQWIAALDKAAAIAVQTGHFRETLDTAQFAFELEGIFTGFHLFRGLLGEPQAVTRSRRAFEALLARSRAAPERAEPIAASESPSSPASFS
ncbi:MAG: TetR family transcriptional regulator [Myxococcales bacterium FL481]|nr:MAG: TetR family transcriptional regulator [Myxococcales bacterium FL481]